MTYRVCDGSGIVVAECNYALDAATVLLRWGFNSSVVAHVGRRAHSLWTLGYVEGTVANGADDGMTLDAEYLASMILKHAERSGVAQAA